MSQITEMVAKAKQGDFESMEYILKFLVCLHVYRIAVYPFYKVIFVFFKHALIVKSS